MIPCLLALLLLLTSCGANKAVDAVDNLPEEPKPSEEPVAEVESVEKEVPAKPENELDGIESGKTVEEMIAEKNAVTPELTVEGSNYGRKKSVSSYLIMGIDEGGVVPATDEIVNGGQCDVILLVVVDEAAGKYTKVQLDRDMMVDMDICDYYGDPISTTNQQLAFAHSYGNGTAASCENVVRCVSHLFGDVEINGYLSVRYDGIPAANDTLGGVCVKIEDDFSKVDETLVMGETVELTGDHTLNYIRARMSVGDGTNAERMRRHRTYVSAFASRFRESLHSNSGIVNDLYNAVSPYMVTNMSSGKLTDLALMCDGFTDCGIVTLNGIATTKTYKNGNDYAEFYADESALQNLIRDLYYVPVN